MMFRQCVVLVLVFAGFLGMTQAHAAVSGDLSQSHLQNGNHTSDNTDFRPTSFQPSVSDGASSVVNDISQDILQKMQQSTNDTEIIPVNFQPSPADTAPYFRLLIIPQNQTYIRSYNDQAIARWANLKLFCK